MTIRTEINKSIKTLVRIRDDATINPAVRVQAVQTLQKLLDDADMSPLSKKRITNKNIRTLTAIRDSEETVPATRVQSIQTLQKFFDLTPEEKDDQIDEADILKKIRSKRT